MKTSHRLSPILIAVFSGLLIATTAHGQVQPGPKDADAPTAFKTTASGLQYRILRKSSGTKPKPTDKVSVHYKGWLDSGKQFDSSYDRGAVTSFPLNRVIPGWTEGLQLIGEGGMIELTIPSELGYRDRAVGNLIPANSTLHFLIELKKIQ